MLRPAAVGLFLLMIAVIARTASAQSTTKDSAGVRIVENVRPVWAAGRGWSLSAQPLIDVGSGEDSLYELATVMGAVRLSDGSIAVANMGTSNIRVYDARGRYVRAIGRRGQGPGEFRQVMGLTRRPGDTLAVLDSRDEIEFYGSGGKFGRWLRHLSHGRELVLSGFYLFDDGSFARTSWPQAHTPRGERWVDSLVVLAVTKSDTSGRVISRHPAMEYTKSPGLAFSQSVTFAPAGFIVADGDGYYVAYADRYEIRRHRLDGTLHLILRAPWTPIRVRESDRQAYRDITINLGAEGGGRVDPRLLAQRKKMMEDVAFAENLPAHSMMQVDSERNLWVSDSSLEWFLGQGFSRVPSTAISWRVFDRNGRWLGAVTMPPRFRPMDIGSDYVLGLWRDADDVEHVRLYRLTKPGA
jgi:hypothetical protein